MNLRSFRNLYQERISMSRKLFAAHYGFQQQAMGLPIVSTGDGRVLPPVSVRIVKSFEKERVPIIAGIRGGHIVVSAASV